MTSTSKDRASPSAGDAPGQGLGLGRATRYWHRPRELDELWRRIEYAFSDSGCSAVVLTGASGSGKSSMVRSGPMLLRAQQAGIGVSVYVPVGEKLKAVGTQQAQEGSKDSDCRQRLVVIDQAERLLPPALGMDQAREEILRVLDETLASAKKACVLPEDRPVVVCLLVLRDDDLARAMSLAQIFELPAFPSSVTCRVAGLDALESTELVSHLGEMDDQQAREWMKSLGWERRLREFLPLHAKISGDVWRMSSRGKDARADKWAGNADPLVYYPRLLLEEMFGPSRARQLLEVCFAMARASWLVERLSGNEREAARTLRIETIRKSFREGVKPPPDLKERLTELCETNLVAQVAEDGYEFTHDYLVAAFAEMDRNETRAAKRTWDWVRPLLSIATVLMLIVFLAVGWLTKRKREELRQTEEALRDTRQTLEREKLEKERADKEAIESRSLLNQAQAALDEGRNSSDLADVKDTLEHSRDSIDSFLRKAKAPQEAFKASDVQTATVRLEVNRAGLHSPGVPLYLVRFWLEGPQQVLDHIEAVRYHFTGPTFIPNPKVGADATKLFAIEYKGYSCIPEVGITVVLKGSLEQVTLPPFPFCKKWPESFPVQQAPATPSAAVSPAAPEVPVKATAPGKNKPDRSPPAPRQVRTVPLEDRQ